MDGAARPVHELAWVIRARRLLAVSLDDHRAIVGRVSRSWLLREAERRLPWERIPPVLQERFRPATGPPPRAIPSNWLPKLEPALNAHVLAGVILLGPRLLGSRAIDLERIVAAMIHETLGLTDGDSAFLSQRCRLIDEDLLAAEFGPGVLHRVLALRGQIARFDTGRPGDLSPEDATALAAIKAARLRLTARAAGDAIFSTLDPAQKEELRTKGIDPTDERPYLEADSARAPRWSCRGRRRRAGPVQDVRCAASSTCFPRHAAPGAGGKYGSACTTSLCAPRVSNTAPSSAARHETSRRGRRAVRPFALPTFFATSPR
jgi:hypothetical protein